THVVQNVGRAQATRPSTAVSCGTRRGWTQGDPHLPARHVRSGRGSNAVAQAERAPALRSAQRADVERAGVVDEAGAGQPRTPLAPIRPIWSSAACSRAFST